MKKIITIFLLPLLFSCGESKEELREQIEERDATISSLNSQIEELQDRVNDLQCTIAEMERGKPAYNYGNQMPASPNVMLPPHLRNQNNANIKLSKEEEEEAFKKLIENAPKYNDR